MSEDQFDAIVVGGGIAGTVAAYLLAQEGLSVMLVERGNYAGSKNMTGGRIYSYSLEKIMPDFAREAPVERKITREKISMLTEESSVTLDYYSDLLGKQGSDSYSVLRGVFDRWLQTKAEEAGAEVVTGIRIDDLLVKDGKVCGVIAGGDELEAKVTILADGVNSLLAQKIGLLKELRPEHVAVGAKEVIELPAKVIEDRFNCRNGEGTAWLFAGAPTAGRVGGGFIYTNKNSVSLGIVSTIGDLVKGGKSIAQMVEDFKQHPAVQPLLQGGTLVEYSGHMVPEGGLNMVPKLVGHGVLVVGDAAGFCINLGYAVRGIDLAVISAQCAAKAAIAALQTDDYSEASLQRYTSYLNESCVMKDMTLYQHLPHVMENTPRMFKEYPQMAADILADLFVMRGRPAEPLQKKIRRHAAKVGMWNLAKDAWKGRRSL